MAIRTALAALLIALLLPTPARAAGDWTWPVRGEVLTTFRNGTDPYAAGQHRGVDIAAPVGADVVAAVAGTVRHAGVAGDSGLTVSVRAGDHDVSYLHPPGGFFATVWSWMTTIDHKKIGVMYLFAVLFMFFLGGMAAMAVRLELWEPVRQLSDGTVVGQMFRAGEGIGTNNNVYNRLFTLHGAIMVFMVIVPSVPASLGGGGAGGAFKVYRR